MGTFIFQCSLYVFLALGLVAIFPRNICAWLFCRGGVKMYPKHFSMTDCTSRRYHLWQRCSHLIVGIRTRLLMGAKLVGLYESQQNTTECNTAPGSSGNREYHCRHCRSTLRGHAHSGVVEIVVHANGTPLHRRFSMPLYVPLLV